MSILKTTHSGSKSIPIASDKTIPNEIEKLGYTYNCTLRCWTCRKYPLPDIIIAHLYNWDGSNIYYIYLDYTTCNSTTYCITNMYDLFNFIEDVKNKYVNS